MHTLAEIAEMRDVIAKLKAHMAKLDSDEPMDRVAAYAEFNALLARIRALRKQELH